MRSRTGGALLLCGLTVAIIGCTPDKARQPGSPPTPGAAGAGDTYYPNDGNGGYDAVDYHVSVSFDPGEGILDGDTTVTATATQHLSRFNLDLRGLEVTSVEVDGTRAEFVREGEAELVITPATPVREGTTFRTRVRYGGKPQEANGYQLGANGWQQSASGGAFVLGEPHSAAFWYPVNETPRDKATFRLDARVPDGWSAISIGTEEGTTSADGWTTWSWSEQTPVASYLTTLAVDKFDIERTKLADGTPVLTAYAPGTESKRADGDRVGEVIEFLGEHFGEYPLDTAGGIYLAEEIGFSLETQGRPTYAEWADLETVVHEIAHQWYGNSVSIDSWADICLNECLASYSQWLWAEGKQDMDLDERYHDAIQRVRGDERFWSAKLYDMGAGNEFGGVYDKGILAVHALRRQIGEEAFARVLPEWSAAHRDGNASWPEFERFVTDIAGQDLGEFFDTWFRGTAMPADEFLFPGSLRR
ncbi:Peptidase family M1 [Amycolatopsis marina]|uniref:Aminopeptidase N n=1 Tax=Amycolatopsis marina TaxID=490629 RepID=A0A1I0Y7L8_9PSEU|nr:M1 family metallopeptidase [Amycolatopsis marina]SFB08468.1 Peptidase family M1 [Amycolatopsis marina]